MERARGVEPPSEAWEASIITVIRRPRALYHTLDQCRNVGTVFIRNIQSHLLWVLNIRISNLFRILDFMLQISASYSHFLFTSLR
jgi:hypothetical protein